MIVTSEVNISQAMDDYFDGQKSKEQKLTFEMLRDELLGPFHEVTNYTA